MTSPPSPAHSNKRTPILRWAGTLLAVVLLIYLLSREGWKEISTTIQHIDAWRLILALLLMLISRLAVAGRWHILMHHAGSGITPQQSIKITFAGLFASNFMPTTIGGDVIRLAGAIRLGFDQATSMASLVVDRLVGMAGMAMALPFALPGWIAYSNTVQTSSTTRAALPLLAITALKIKQLTKSLQSQLVRLWEVIRIWLRKPEALAKALAFTWLHMICIFGQVWLILGGVKEQVSFWLIAGLWSATYFVTLLPISINGMGVQELSMTFFFTTFANISQSSGLSLALLMRLLQMLASLPGALTIPGLLEGKESSGV